MKSGFASALFCAASLLAAGAADARIYEAVSNPVEQQVSRSTYVALTNAPVSDPTSLAFSVPVAGTYLISVSTVCAVYGAGGEADYDLTVDRRESSFVGYRSTILCSSDSTTTLDHPERHTLLVPINLTAGSHVLRLRINQLGSSSTVWLDELAVQIFD